MRSGKLWADLGEARDRRVGRRLRRRRRAGSTDRTSTARAVRRAPAWDRPRSGRRPRSRAAPRAARPGVGRRGRQVGEREADVDRARPWLGPGPRGKSGRPSSSSMTLTTGPSWRQPVGLRQPGERRGSPRVGIRQHGRGAQLAPVREHDAARPPLVDHDPLDRRLDVHARAGRLGRRAQRRGHGAHAAARETPRARRAGRLAELVVEGDERGSRILRAGERSDQALDRERHPHLPRTGSRPARRRSSRRASPARSPRASARGRAARAAAAARGRRRAASARSSRRSRRRPRATNPARAARGCGPARTR